MLCSGYFLLYLAKLEQVFLQVIATPPKALQVGFTFFIDLADQDLKTPHNSECPPEAAAPHHTHKAGGDVQGEDAQPVLGRDGCMPSSTHSPLCNLNKTLFFTLQTQTPSSERFMATSSVLSSSLSASPSVLRTTARAQPPPQPVGFCVCPAECTHDSVMQKDSTESPLHAAANNTNIPK